MSQEKIDRAKQVIFDAIESNDEYGVAEGHYRLAFAYEEDLDFTYALGAVHDAWNRFMVLNDSSNKAKCSLLAARLYERIGATEIAASERERAARELREARSE